MAGVKEIRTRIVSVTSTRKITSAMKMVSAAKLRKAQNAVIQMRPYSLKLEEIFENISSGLDSAGENVYIRQRNVERVAIILISSNSGLCGAFNTNIAKYGVAVAREKYAYQLSQGWVDFYCVGKKGAEQLRSRGFVAVESYNSLLEKVSYQQVSEVAARFMDLYVAGKYDAVEIVYNKFKNAASQYISAEQFLPLTPREKKQFEVSNDYIFEPSEEQIMDDLIPKILRIKFYSALLESVASEHGARMTAMHKATDNATEFLKALRLEYNKARQASITNEILEIVSGANALNG